MRLPALRAFGYSFSAHQRHGPSDYHIKCFNVSRDRIQIHQKHLAVRPPYELPLPQMLGNWCEIDYLEVRVPDTHQVLGLGIVKLVVFHVPPVRCSFMFELKQRRLTNSSFVAQVSNAPFATLEPPTEYDFTVDQTVDRIGTRFIHGHDRRIKVDTPLPVEADF